jgi:hypothetical protein
MTTTKIFTVTENGFSMVTNKYAIPACKIKAKSHPEAIEKLSKYLYDQIHNNDIELLTPIEKIDFKQAKAKTIEKKRGMGF